MNEFANVATAPKFGAAELGSRCLVTGGAGYVGRTIVRRLLEAGCQVRSFDMMKHGHGDGVETVVGDLRDYHAVRDACEGVDTVFHTAAVIKLQSIYRPSLRRMVFEINAVGTANVARAADDAGVKALVHTSTFNVALDGNTIDQDETLPYATHAKDLYSLSKIEAERLALAGDKPGGLRVCALRPGGVWGSDTGSIMIKSFLTQLAAGKFKALVGDRNAVMDNTHVENLVDAQLLAAKALRTRPDAAGGQAYFITDDEATNGMLWFKPLAEGLGFPFPKTWLPSGLMRAVATLMEIANLLGAPEPVLTIRGMRNLSESSRLKINKAQRDLGYVPRYKMANGIPLLLPAARSFIAAQQGAK